MARDAHARRARVAAGVALACGSLLLIVVLEVLGRAACAGTFCDPAPGGPVMSPAIGVVALPILLVLVAIGVWLRRRAWHVT